MALLYHYSLQNVPLANSPVALEKYRSIMTRYQMLARNGIPLPPTGIAARMEDLPRLIDEVGGPPITLRLLYGSRSQGIVMADSSRLVSTFALGILEIEMVQTDSRTMVTDINPAPEFGPLEDEIRSRICDRLLDYMESIVRTNS